MLASLMWLAVGCGQPVPGKFPGSRAIIHVNAVGDDHTAAAAAGCTADRPFRTLSAAQAAARFLQQRGIRGVTVSVSAGVYPPLALTALDSGTSGEDGEVRYQGAPGAVISGGVTLPPGSPVAPEDPVFGRLPEATRAYARRFEVGGLIGPSPSEIVSGAVQLVCDGRPLDLAAWPSNGSWAHTGPVVGRDGFTFPADAPIPADADGLWAEGCKDLDALFARAPQL